MHREVVMELQAADGTWRPIGSVSEAEPPGSISHDAPGGRRVLVFGCHGGTVGVWESRAGVDAATDLARTIWTLDLALLSDLTEPYHLEVYRAGRRVPLRFRQREADPLR